MKRLFAVIRTFGGSWQPDSPLEGQKDWPAHAAFMNALHAEGFVVYGGPLESTNDVLLIIHAESPEEIRARLAADSWSANGLLQINQIAPWTLRLGQIEGHGKAAREQNT
jgi:uncharacterized protein YciI